MNIFFVLLEQLNRKTFAATHTHILAEHIYAYAERYIYAKFGTVR